MMTGKQNSILSYFPKGLEPRPGQREALEFVEKVYNKADVIVLNLPVASGKSYIAYTIQAWLGQGSSAILTNNNILVDQYHQDFPKLAAIYGKGYVQCLNKAEDNSEFDTCADRYEWAAKNKLRKYCPGCPYYTATKRFYTPSRFNYITNYYKYVNLKGQFKGRGMRETLIIDEAHNLSSAIAMFNQKRIWKHDLDYSQALNAHEFLERDKLKILAEANNINWLAEEMSNIPKYIFQQGKELYRGKQLPCLLGQPVDIRGLNNPIWNPTNKLILMSATISKNDIIELGLNHRKVYYHESESCIPADRRPVYFEPVGTIKGQDLFKTSALVASKIKELMAKYNQKGLVHATYAQANALKMILGNNDKILFHDRTNKKAMYQNFRTAPEGTVLIASGLYEGIDLPDDYGRWQILGKVPWPNKGEPAIAYASEIDPNSYTWSTAKQVLQACGRICRKPDDYGSTYLIDETFRGLYTNNQSYWPKWWKESLHGL